MFLSSKWGGEGRGVEQVRWKVEDQTRGNDLRLTRRWIVSDTDNSAWRIIGLL
jgi:hypothetical protein